MSIPTYEEFLEFVADPDNQQAFGELDTVTGAVRVVAAALVKKSIEPAMIGAAMATVAGELLREVYPDIDERRRVVGFVAELMISGVHPMATSAQEKMH